MSASLSAATPDAVALVQGTASLPAPKNKTLEAARQFEGLLMSLVFESMRKTIEPSGLFGGSASTRSTYDYLLDQAVADKAAGSGHGWGLANCIAASWSRGPARKPASKG